LNVISIRLEDDLLKRIQSNLYLTNIRNRNEFIKKSIEFYCVYLQLDGEPDVFSKIVGNIVEGKISYLSNCLEKNRKKDLEHLLKNQAKILNEISKINTKLIDMIVVDDGLE
jgi:metal-responsive CopG/Arc/MetJ family transcriptional regulator